ncbi:MAG: S-methyl-5-thioribose-1-phosphate isomerase [Actinobacteria bacterium]|nr:S-methyl-5-thioribose-1-phosphate isomerase [Actinomycetota bacterium]MBU1945239.1 S-methyl-5-thioribose-1-phosphate isomerase [Actinomycetota bacterium]MBU2687811.1 S-methyl-5-thioribose-1-phosphate isomerase [Actinomycetota bacterium]
MREPGDSIYYEDGVLFLLDQTLLPTSEVLLELDTHDQVVDAIRRLAVRGAMAIGVAGAYGVVLGAISAGSSEPGVVRRAARVAIQEIGASRPTARNLFWALERMDAVLQRGASDTTTELIARLRGEADAVALDTIETNRSLVECGQELIGEGAVAITHCNSGPLAALRYGTAVGVLMEAHRRGKSPHVYVDETRPLLQGSRLTAWELGRAGVAYTLICDGMAADVMRAGKADLVITGADRIAANGDSANKIGTYGLALAAHAHDIPFYIAAPFSTVDPACPGGDAITIEERDPDEVRYCAGAPVAPPSAPVYNPAFDVTPAGLIAGIVTEHGVLRPPYTESLLER